MKCNKKQYRYANYYDLGDLILNARNKFGENKLVQNIGGVDKAIKLLSGASSIAGNAIGGGYSLGAGDALSSLGNIASSIPIPQIALAGDALNIVGGITNRLAGSKLNQENINKINQEINAANSFTTDAGDYDSLFSNISNAPTIAGFSRSDVGKDGVFGNKARKIYKKLKRKATAAEDWIDSSIDNNAENIATNVLGDLESNYFDSGGDLFPIFTNGVSTINAGGTHESNPNNGVQLGVDSNGVPNLVEEGEVIYNNYVYSNRIQLPLDLQQKYKTKGTFADAAKKTQKESEERPNDPISKKGLETAMLELANRQELEREDVENTNIFEKGGPIFNPYTKRWTWGGKAFNTTVQKPWGRTVYTKDGFAVDYNKQGREISRKKGTQTPSITGKTRNEREQNYFDRDKTLTDSVKAIAKRYGISPNLLASRMAREGIDNQIDKYNYSGGKSLFSSDKHEKGIAGETWGLDWFTDNLNTGKTKLKESWVKHSPRKFTNDFGTQTNTAVFKDWNGIVSATAAELAGRRQRLQKNYPKLNSSQLDALSLASFNYGEDAINKKINKGQTNSLVKAYAPFINIKALGGNIFDGLTQSNYMDNMKLKGKIEDIISPEDLPSFDFNKPEYNIAPLFEESNLRYAPVLMSGLSAIGDIFSKPDYSAAKRVESVNIIPPQVRNTPVGQRLTYTPMDKQFYINPLNKNAAYSRSLARNISGGNRATALNALANIDANYIEGLGKLARQAEEYNENLKQKVADFNRATDTFNAQQSLSAQNTNAGYIDNATKTRLNQVETAAKLRQLAKDAYNNRRSNNLNNFINNLGNLGWEAVNRNMINSNPALYYALSQLGNIKYK